MRIVPFLALAVLGSLTLGQGCPPATYNPGGGDVTSPGTLGGTVNFANLTIPAGHTTTVTGDLHIKATGNVVIDGELVAADAEEGDGYGITIEADGDVDVSGVIKAGNAASPQTSSTFSAAQAGELTDDDPLQGKHGGAITIRSKGNVTLRKSAMIEATNGINGFDGPHGGRGGDGGDIFLVAGGILDVHCSLHIGSGGDGGTAQTTPGNLPDDGEFRNCGGRSGWFFISLPQTSPESLHMPALIYWEGSDIITVDAIRYSADPRAGIITGGIGGSAGPVTITDLDAAWPSTSHMPQLHALRSRTAAQANNECPAGWNCVRGASGGDGWYMGGFGSYVIASLALTLEGNDGSSWSVYGGSGGNVRERVELAQMTLGEHARAVIALDAVGGSGGMVSLLTPAGQDGDSEHVHGGNGGHAAAYGGRGGEASVFAAQIGGLGGNAVVQAGSGGSGSHDGCSPGSGGDGGYASAYGGYGGNGITPGQGGTATAIAGQGGAGGDGGEYGGGAGGAGGLSHEEDGCPGASEPDGSVVTCGLIRDGRAADGERGIDDIYCCVCE